MSRESKTHWEIILFCSKKFVFFGSQTALKTCFPASRQYLSSKIGFYVAFGTHNVFIYFFEFYFAFKKIFGAKVGQQSRFSKKKPLFRRLHKILMSYLRSWANFMLRYDPLGILRLYSSKIDFFGITPILDAKAQIFNDPARLVLHQNTSSVRSLVLNSLLKQKSDVCSNMSFQTHLFTFAKRF